MGVQGSGTPDYSELAHERPSVAIVGSGVDSECVLGPWRGFFVGAYVTELAGVFYGYAKLFASASEDIWLQRPVLKIGTRGFNSASDALQDAERRAKLAAAELLEPHFEGLWASLLSPIRGHTPARV
jgi:hypothetical protein